MKNTKRSLLFSILAMILCVAMLASTTLAWFTDTASTAVNKIQAGNLDIEVEYPKDGSSWTDIQGTTSLFSNNLWEPGHTEYVYLKVKNAGSLALKYKVMVTPVSENGGINMAGNNFKLSEHLMFGTTVPATAFTAFADRNAASAAATMENGLTQESINNLNNLDHNYFEYNPSSGIIDTNSVASASSSFNREGFMKLFPVRDASGAEVAPAAYNSKTAIAYMTLQSALESVTGLSGEYIVLLRDTSEGATIPEGAKLSMCAYGNKLNNLVNNGNLAFENGSSVAGTGTIINNGTLALSCTEATGFKVENNGVLNITYCGDGFAYDQNNITNNAGGQITAAVNKAIFKNPIDSAWSSLPFYKSALQSNGYYALVPYSDQEAIADGAVVRYGDASKNTRKYFMTLQEGVQGQAVYMLKDVTESVTREDGNISFYGEDFTFTGSLSSSANLNIYNGTAVLNSIKGVKLAFGSTYNTKGLNVTVKGGTVTGDITVYNNKTGGTTAVIEGGTYAGTITVKTGASLTIKGGTFTADPTKYVAEGYTAARNEAGGTWTVTANAS